MKNLLILVCLIALLSCKQNESGVARIDSKGCIEIPVDLSSPQIVDMDKTLRSVFYVKLETNPESVIGTIDRVFCDDGKIFVFDKKMESVLIFDMKGKYLNKIASKGKGPGEYIILEDINLNVFKKRLEIPDVFRKRVLFFNYQGKFTGELKFDKQIYSNLTSNKEGEFIIHNQMRESSKIIDFFSSDGKLSQDYFESDYPDDDYNYFASLEHPVAAHANKMYFLLHMNESIYSVENGNCKEAFRFVFGKNRYSDIKDDYFKSGGGMDQMFAFYSKYKLPLTIDNLFISDKIFTVTIKQFPNCFDFYIDKTSGKSLLVNNWNFSKKLAFIPNQCVGTSKDYFISIVPSDAVMNLFEELNRNNLRKVDPKGYDEIEALYNKTKFEDNPILMFYQMKM